MCIPEAHSLVGSSLTRRTVPEERIFVGRKAELEAFDEILRDPAGQAILIVGQQGMGKTMLVNKMADIAPNCPGLTCGAVRYEVTPTEPPEAVMEKMLQDAYDAARVVEGSFDGTPRRTEQWRALFGAVGLLLPGAKELFELALSLFRDPKRSTREQFISKLELISRRMPDAGRALFVIDPAKHMHPGSDQTWAIVARDLPPKIKLLFAQRPDGVLASSNVFLALDNVVRIPDRDLGILADDEVEELVMARAKPGMPLVDDVREAVARYGGHPFAVPAALDLIEGGLELDGLPGDPTGIAASQWKLVRRRGVKAIRLFKAYALLEVPVPDSVVLSVGELGADTHQHLMADNYLCGLLDGHRGRKRIYHSIPADHVRELIPHREAAAYHRRAIREYRRRLNADVKPDPLAASRLPEHVRVVDGDGAFAATLTDECAGALVSLGLLDTASIAVDQALSAPGIADPQEAALLGLSGVIARTRGNLNGAELRHRKSLGIFQALGRIDGVAGQKGNLGLVYRMRGQLRRAEKAQRVAVRLSLSVDNLKSAAAACGNLAAVLLCSDQLEAAEVVLCECLDLNTKLNRLEGLGRTFGNLGMLAQRQGKFGRSELFHRIALQVFGRLGHAAGLADQHGNMGCLCLAQDRLDEAAAWFEKVLDAEMHLERPESIATAHSNLGVVEAKRENFKEAKRHHQVALTIHETMGNRAGAAGACLNLGLACHELGERADAERLYKAALSAAKELNLIELQAHVLFCQGRLHVESRQYAQARDLWLKAIALLESINMHHMVPMIRGYLERLPLG